jgi:hypothetical protein
VSLTSGGGVQAAGHLRSGEVSTVVASCSKSEIKANVQVMSGKVQSGKQHLIHINLSSGCVLEGRKSKAFAEHMCEELGTDGASAATQTGRAKFFFMLITPGLPTEPDHPVSSDCPQHCKVLQRLREKSLICSRTGPVRHWQVVIPICAEYHGPHIRRER